MSEQILRRSPLRLLGAIAGLLAPAGAFAADVTFTGLAANPADRSFWDIVANWSTLAVPGAGDNALLGDFTVNHRVNSPTIISFQSGATGILQLTGGTLGYTGASSVANFTQSSGVLSGNSDVTFTNSAALTAGTHTGTGTTLVGGGAGPYAVGSVRFEAGRTLRNVGTLMQTAGSNFLDFVTTPAGSGRLVNEGTFNVTTGATRGFTSGGGVLPADVIRNQGTINKTGAGQYVVAAPLDQRGTLSIADGTLFLNADAIARSGSTTGGAGLLVVNGTVLTAEAGANLQTANVRMDFGGARIDYSADLVLNSLVQNSGTVSGAGQFSTLGSMALNGGTHTGTGTTLVGSGTGPYAVGSVRFEAGRTLRNVGTLTQLAGSNFLDFVTTPAGSGRLVNEGTFNVTTGATRGFIDGGGVLPADVIRNQGTINKTGAGQYVVAAPLDQRGTLSIADGTLFLNADAIARSGSTTGGAGLLVVNGTVLTAEAGANLQTANVRMDFGGARIDYSADLVLNSLVQNSGTVSGAGQFSTLGSMALNGGTHTGTGTTLVGSGTGPYAVGSVRFEAGRTLRNVGTLTQLAGSNFLDFVTTPAGSGRLVNEGTFNVTTGATRGFIDGGGVLPADVIRNQGTVNKTGAGQYVVAAPLDQQGQLNVAEGTVFLNANARQAAGETRIAVGATLVANGVQLVQTGGTLTVEGTLRTDFAAGRIEMQGGVLTGNGTVRDNAYGGPIDFALTNVAGRIAPGSRDSVGVLTIDAGLQNGPDGFIEFDILDSTTFDVIQITRSSIVGGIVDVDPLGAAFTPSLGQRFRVANLTAGYTGTFSAVSSTEPFGAFFVAFDVAYNADNIELVVGTLAPVPEPSVYAMLMVGLIGVIWMARRRRTSSAAAVAA